MPNLSSIFRLEVARLARKEIKSEIESLRKITTLQRKQIAALKRELAAMKRSAPRAPRGATAVAAAENAEAAEGRALQPRGLLSHRQKLGLSQAEYGRLVGASALSINRWESGKVKPRAAQMQRLRQVRSLGKKAALALLASQ